MYITPNVVIDQLTKPVAGIGPRECRRGEDQGGRDGHRGNEPGLLERLKQPRHRAADGAAVDAYQEGSRERHPHADAEHLWWLVSRRVEQRDDLDQRQERDGTDED